MDTTDVYYCFDAATGKERWKHLNPAPAEKELDYGNSPRATPLIHGKLVFLTGAFGQLHCLELETGKIVWEMDLRDDFEVKDERKWGHCSSPLIVDDRLVVNPGGKDASLVALEPSTGKVLWKSPGAPASYGNLIVATLGGKKQIVGFDLESLGGWDPATGKRLWTLKPDRRSDFNVPTPIAIGDRLLVPWENNGTLLFRFDKNGVIDPQPVASYARLAPDTHSPVVTAGRVFGAWNGLHCLDLDKKLSPMFVRRETVFTRYLSLVASEDRVLAITHAGELLLLDARATKYKPLDRLRILEDETGLHAHPAFVGTRMYLRGDDELLCIELSSDSK